MNACGREPHTGPPHSPPCVSPCATARGQRPNNEWKRNKRVTPSLSSMSFPHSKQEDVCAREDDAPCLASLCDPGYFCSPGSTSARAHQCGSGEYYCPRGSGFPTPVDVGYYTYVEGSNNGGLGDSWSLAGQVVRGGHATCFGRFGSTPTAAVVSV